MPAVPVGASTGSACSSMPSSPARLRASCAPASSPSAQMKRVAAPARAAAVAWLKPLPPGPVRYSPTRVSPHRGSCGKVQTWSTLNEPTTTTSGRDSGANAIRFRRVRIVLVLEQQHERHRDHQRIQREGHPDAVPVLAVVGMGEPMLDDETAGDAAEHRADAVGHHHEKTLRAGAYLRVALALDEQRT